MKLHLLLFSTFILLINCMPKTISKSTDITEQNIKSYLCQDTGMDFSKVDSLFEKVISLCNSDEVLYLDSCSFTELLQIHNDPLAAYSNVKVYSKSNVFNNPKVSGSYVYLTYRGECADSIQSPYISITVIKCFNGSCHDGVIWDLFLKRVESKFIIIEKKFGGYFS